MPDLHATAQATRLAQFESAARSAGLKLTHQRLEIFRELATTAEHPDVDKLFRAVRARVPTVSLDTVYRTVWMLHDLGLITTLGGRARAGVRFDTNLARHHHYVCVRCGLVRDFESGSLDALEVPAVAKAFGSVLVAQVEVRGVCEACRNQPSRDDAAGAEPISDASSDDGVNHQL